LNVPWVVGQLCALCGEAGLCSMVLTNWELLSKSARSNIAINNKSHGSCPIEKSAE